MNEIIQEIQTTCQAPSSEGERWFATLDASQIPAAMGVDWTTHASGWSNVLEPYPEGQEHDLTCWLMQLDRDRLSLTLEMAKQFPHAFTWFSSTWAQGQIARHWAALCDATLPNGHQALFRLYDPCVLLRLDSALTSGLWEQVQAPTIQWLMISPDGHLVTKHSPRKKTDWVRPRRIRLNEKQVAYFMQSNQAHRLIAELAAHEHLTLGVPHFDAYRRIQAVVTHLNRHGITDMGQHYIHAAASLDWESNLFESEPLLHRQLRETAKASNGLLDIAPFQNEACDARPASNENHP